MRSYMDYYYEQNQRPAMRALIDRLVDEVLEPTSPTGTSPSGTSPDPELEEWRALTQPLSRRPLAWEDFVGNEAAVETLREAITAAEIQNRPMAHTLLWGSPGTGKTTLSKLVAQTLGGGYIETTASTLETPLDVIRLLIDVETKRKETGQPTVVFVDEIHMLGQARGRLAVDQESLFPLLEDFQFFHNATGKSVDNNGLTWTLNRPEMRVGPFTLVGATTEPGMLSAPLLRRMLVHVEMRPYSDDDIVKIILGAAGRLGWPLDPPAAAELAKYSRKNPGVAQQRLTAGRNRALGAGREVIDVQTVTEVVARLRLYPLGLTELDVQILKILADRAPRGAGQAEIARACGISLSTFTMCEGYLRALGLMETLARRVIRPEGLVYLARLGMADNARPEVRAAVAAAEKGVIR